ncbi:exopolyphosphatase/guanosine-5'-triphosphate,3'-diphosphate pyrophosphatase [Kineosphaera limosa]|nr:Ppx/GppA phosphatase family protein [Kineosphaera limosa]NYE01715.1 exopolyphosphatase/guanosine-5'-triphosphate,3'-diphosphate pyrophosphatase [Kineosphaera limosa]
MRLGVIDVGSNTVHLLVVDAHWGAQPMPASSHKIDLRLSEHTTADGRISDKVAKRLEGFVRECVDLAEDLGIEQLMGFATSAIREAPNGEQVLAGIRASTGVNLEVLTGEAESRLTFLAARRWFGWSAGRLLLVDIGGGSLELATGLDEDPDVAVSLPLGAGRLTRERLTDDPPTEKDVRALRRYVRAQVAGVVRDLSRVGEPDLCVGTSKTIRSLARLAGAAASGEGPYVRRVLARRDLKEIVPRLAALDAKGRSALPGVSVNRSRQVLAGALVVDAAMDLLGVEKLVVCPWALREGIILQHLDLIPAP